MDWFIAIWWVTTQKNGASALGLQQVLGLKSHETSWTWLHKIRKAMVNPNRAKLSGTIEIDETYLGGEAIGKQGRGAENSELINDGWNDYNGIEGKGYTRIINIQKNQTADKGYQCITDIHLKSLIPIKKPRKGKLTAEQKRFNRNLSSFRIKIEHVNRRIKRFKILQHRYRNKQRKHFLRVSLICAIYNFELRF